MSNYNDNKMDVNVYSNKNLEFIVVNGGISKFRCLRAHLLPSKSNQRKYIYDIVIQKYNSETTKSKKEEKLRQTKAQLGALSPKEIEEMNEEISRDILFFNNPFYYGELIDLLKDINFKLYLASSYNTVFLLNHSVIRSFNEIPEEDESIFVAEIEFESQIEEIYQYLDKFDRDKRYSKPKDFNAKCLLDKHEEPLHLNNLAATDEFYKGDPNFSAKHTTVSPLNCASLASSIYLAKALNNTPLREKDPVVTLLPPLPQYFLLHKAAFKQFPLRNVCC